MADPIPPRKFWIIPGEVDPKTGRPIEFQTKPSIGIRGSGLVLPGEIGLGGYTKEPVEVTETMSPDGEYVQTTVDPQSGQTVEIARDIDQHRRELAMARDAAANTQADNARADRKAKADADAAAAKAQTPEERALQFRKDQAEAAIREQQAAPQTIEVPKPNAGLLDTGASSSRVVSKVQFDAEQALLENVRRAEATVIAREQLAVSQRSQTAEEAHRKVQDGFEQIRIEMSKQMAALTQRGQDISIRGQDMSAKSAERGQNMTYETSLAGDVSANARASLPFWNAPGQLESYNSLMRGGPPVATRPGPPPIAPDLPFTAAMQARAQAPAPMVIPGAPAQVPLSQFSIPPRP